MSQEIVHSNIRKTDWGLVIDFPHRNGDAAFLEYPGSFCRNWKEVDLEKEYDCEIFYSLWHAMTPKESNMAWFRITADTPGELLERSREEILKYGKYLEKHGTKPVSICYAPDEKEIFPYFCLRNP